MELTVREMKHLLAQQGIVLEGDESEDEIREAWHHMVNRKAKRRNI
jgi:hypothetical protein